MGLIQKGFRACGRVMSILFLTILLASCASDRYPNRDELKLNDAKNPTTAMGVRYLLGRGVIQNDKKAFYYFNKAAHQEDPFAQNELAYLYAAGKGTAKDEKQALFWYQKAANHGLVSAQYNLGLLYLHGIGTPVNRKLAVTWIGQSAAHGFEPAKVTLEEITLARLRTKS